MCNTWQHQGNKNKEISSEIMDKIPSDQRRINLTGGEPALRDDLENIVKVLIKKTPRLEISTNGYFTKKLVEIGRRFPQVTFRISIEGLPKLNDDVRGIKNGFEHALKTVLSLLDAGVKDVGFGMVVTDKNAKDLLYLYKLCSRMGIEFATSTIHNSFYFNKEDNKIDDIPYAEAQMTKFITALLQSDRNNLRLRIKDWGRAYINFGLLKNIQGQKRPLTCGAATDIFFLDPYGRVLACNGSEKPWIMGNLKEMEFDPIWNSSLAVDIRRKVKHCKRNCWMVGTAVPAMRRRPWVPFFWIAKNKFHLARYREISLT
jgi:MoaA/NifB/PqqE/SkfB family radical SAM enzyme